MSIVNRTQITRNKTPENIEMKVLPLKYNALLFGVTAVITAGLYTLLSELNPVMIWGTPIGALIGINIGYTTQYQRGSANLFDERDYEILDTAMAWGFVIVLLGIPAVLTYRSIQPPLSATDFIWISFLGIIVTGFVAGILELQHRNLA